MFNDLNLQQQADQLFQSNVWYEKYRPRTLDQLILPEYIKDKLKMYLKDQGKNLPHLGLFSKTPGTGKSSLAKVILNELKAESLWINASLDKGIDVLRTRIQQFACQVSLRGSVKIVVLDEFDSFSRDGQAAFRGFVDTFGDNVRFIFTGNNKENIIEPLLDRMEIYDFNQFSVQQIAKPILQRLEFILNSEHVEYKREDLLQVIKNNYPRIRKMIGDLGAGLEVKDDGSKIFNYSYIGSPDKLNAILILMKQKDIRKVKTAIYSLGSVDHIYGFFTENIEMLFDNKNEQLINAIIALAKYQYQASFAKDKQLNALACCFELMKLL